MAERQRPGATRSYGSAMSEAGPFLSFGIQLAGTLLLLIWGGHWVDGRFGTEPWGLLAGVIFGMAGAVALFVKLFAELKAQQRPRKPAPPKGGPGGAPGARPGAD